MTRAEGAITRRERRSQERDERRQRRDDDRARLRRSTRNGSAAARAWRSPMVAVTIGALLIGAVVVAFAFTQQRPAGPATGDLSEPLNGVSVALAEGRTIGAPDAPVTVEIWSDFQCPACRKLAVEIEPSILVNFVEPGTARLVYRDAAYQGARGQNPNYDESVEAAAGARCAAEQGLFWQMHDWLFANWNGENEGAFNADRLRAIAAAAGVELAAYDTCMASRAHQAAVRAETQSAVSLGYTATPTLVINGYATTGVPSVAELSQLIRAAADQATLPIDAS